MGRLDCGLMLADWVLLETGRDPAARIRGLYQTQDQGCALLRTKHMPIAFGRAFRAVGLRQTSMPAYGDICMIELGGSVRGAIRTRGFAVLANGAGVSRVVSARLVVAWSLHG